MILPILKYGHPVLRKKGARVETISSEVLILIRDMFETMYAARGVGLAAPQVGQVLQLTVVDVRGVTDRPSSIEMNGKPADVVAFMPLVLINPEIKPLAEAVTGVEGCLSFPEIYADITRPGHISVRSMSEKGEQIDFRCGGLLAKAIQHEVDHLQGILFIDRMSPELKEEFKPQLEKLHKETKAALKKKLATA